MEHQELLLVAVGDANGIFTLGNSSSVPYKTEYTLQSSNCAFWDLPSELKTYAYKKNLLKNIDSSFIYNHQNLEAIKMSFSS